MKDNSLPTALKVRLVCAMVFPVVMYGCESWTPIKSEQRRIETFEMWRWRRVLKLPWTSKTPNRTVLDIIVPKTPLMSMIVKQALSYLGHVMRAGGLEAATAVGKVAGTRRSGRQRMRWLDWVALEAGSSWGS